MISHYLKFAIRILRKDKLFSVLNILGLTFSIAVSILLILYLERSLTYDHSHLKHNRIYRLGSMISAPELDFKRGLSARELEEILLAELPEIEEIVRIEKWNHVLVRNENEKAFYEDGIVNADAGYFNVFTHKFISGDPATCLKAGNSIILTASVASKYFGDENPIGKELQLNDHSWFVTAVIEDLADNLHLRFDLLVSKIEPRDWVVDNLAEGESISEAYWNPDVYMYLLLPDNYNPEGFYSKFSKINELHIQPFGDQINGKYDPVLEPLNQIHFYSTLEDNEVKGNPTYIYALSGIGIFVILLACINYVNLSTAKSINRAAEISVKKVLGSNKRSLLVALMTESILLTLIATVLAIFIIVIISPLPSIVEILGTNVASTLIHNPTLFFGSIGISLIIGLLSGLYPSFYLTSTPVITGLKGKGPFKNPRASLMLRNSLIGFQFFISILVIVGTLFIGNQIEYLRNQNLGFDSKKIIALPIEGTAIKGQLDGFKNEMLGNSFVSHVTTTHDVMGKEVGNGVLKVESEAGMVSRQFTILSAGEDYFQTLGIELLMGRVLKPQVEHEAEGRREFIVNEATVRMMSWSDPIGKKLKFFHDEEDGVVVGVVKDFNFTSLHSIVAPVAITESWDDGGDILIKYSGSPAEIIDKVEKMWKTYDSSHPFEYYFLDEKFNDQYKQEELQHSLLTLLSNICLFISLLGLVGLSAFASVQRTKEIGIRKVLGATIPSIIYMLYKNIMVLILLAVAFAIPVSVFLSDVWLSNFAYKAEIQYSLFILVAIVALLITFVLVLFQSLRAASANPVDALKYE